MNDYQRQHGQYFTLNNAFTSPAFATWLDLVRQHVPAPRVILEPFAGAGNIPLHLSASTPDFTWACYDIDPSPFPVFPGAKIIQRDVLVAFPAGYQVAITNPPYLARNSARRRHLSFPWSSPFGDLYQIALAQMLAHCSFVAAIIPESFITQNLFFDRLSAVVSLKDRLFADTECPVCLVLFVPATLKANPVDFSVWDGSTQLGNFLALSTLLPDPVANEKWVFNDPHGPIGLLACDNQRNASIRFALASSSGISSAEIKVSSRARTRIGNPTGFSSALLVASANQLLNVWRSDSHDILLTPFKGLRQDGSWRRRLDFATARRLLNLAVDQVSDRLSK